MEGESVTLDPELTDIQSDKEIDWRFGEVRFARVFKHITNYYGDTFTNRLKMYRNGSLTITNTRTTDSGLYKLSTIIQNKVSERRFSVTVDGNKPISTITPQNPLSSDDEVVYRGVVMRR
ncbi:hypothetical protein cypCar_00031206 [Cyprinus carpio]|nr:hypothetical protein cypCar_00031206 [Cyprinus carpio]